MNVLFYFSFLIFFKDTVAVFPLEVSVSSCVSYPLHDITPLFMWLFNLKASEVKWLYRIFVSVEIILPYKDKYFLGSPTRIISYWNTSAEQSQSQHIVVIHSVDICLKHNIFCGGPN